MLGANLFEQYDKMIQDMIKDMEDLDRAQFEEYNRLFDKNILEQFQSLGFSQRTYNWKETDSARILIFSGHLDESATPSIEIKDNFFSIKATFVTRTNINGQKNVSKKLVSLKVSLPGDIDSSKVSYKNLETEFRVIFPKLTQGPKIKKKEVKPLRSPIKKKPEVTI